MEFLKKVGGWIAFIILLAAVIAGILIWENLKGRVDPKHDGESCSFDSECRSGYCRHHVTCRPESDRKK